MKAIILCISSCFVFQLLGQNATSTLSGSVTDPTGATISGAEVTAISQDRSQERHASSGREGFFTLPLLPPGKFRVQVKKEGFTTAELSDVELRVGETVSIQITLRVGATTESVTVTANFVESTPTVGTVIDRALLENIPLNGRSFQSLILLTPGVVPAPATSTRLGQFSVNGQRDSANYFTVDGLSANTGISVTSNLYGAAGNFAGYNAVGGTNSLVTVDALQEFRIQTSNFAPEFGRTPGAQVSIITRSGSNQFHGSLFEYFRNDVLDANDWFANTQGLKKAPLRQNQFGGVLGGPVTRNKTFFFASYEGLRLRLPQVQIKTVPSLASRQSATGVLQQIYNAFPVPNGPDLGSGFSQWIGGWSDPSTSNAGSIRVDHSFNSRANVFFRYNNAPSESVQRGSGAMAASNTFGTYLSAQTFTAAMTWLAKATLVNDFRVNYSRNGGDLRGANDSFAGSKALDPAAIFPPGISSAQSEVQIYLNSAFDPLLSIGRRTTNRQQQINVVESLSLTRGSHQWKFGGDYRTLFPSQSYAPYDQFVYFDSVAQALSGMARHTIVSTFSGPIELRFHELSAYAQDTWRVSSRLALTYGLRWELNPPFSEAHPQLPALPEQLDLASLSSLRLLPAGTPFWHTRSNNFAPRLGATYSFREQSRFTTVLRGGAGLFYDASASPYVGNALGGFSYPYQTFKDIGPPVPYPLPAAVAAAPPATGGDPPYTIVGFDPNLRLPYSAHWNFGVEQSIGGNQTISATFVGALGHRLYYTESTGNPTPTISRLRVVRNGAESSYNSLQLQFRRRLSHGVQGLASYTFAKSLDTASDEFAALPPTLFSVPALERGPSSFDYRHSFNGAIAAVLPFRNLLARDWGFDVLMNALSAPPVNPTFTNSSFGVTLRPDLLSGVPLYLFDPTFAGGKRINRAAFATLTTSRQGTLGRNALRGFDAVQVNFAVHRNLSITERLKMDLRFEAFNLLNHPNFASPVATVTNALFGRSTQMLNRGLGGQNALYQLGGPRSIQLGVKLHF